MRRLRLSLTNYFSSYSTPGIYISYIRVVNVSSAHALTCEIHYLVYGIRKQILESIIDCAGRSPVIRLPLVSSGKAAFPYTKRSLPLPIYSFV